MTGFRDQGGTVASIDQRPSFEPSLIAAARRYWALVLVLTMLGALAGVAYASRKTKSYVGRAGIVITPMAAPLTANGSAGISPTDYVNRQVALLQSPDVLRDAAAAVNAKHHRQVLSAGDLQQALAVIPPAGVTSGPRPATSSNVTQVNVTLGDPVLAADAANAVLDTYKQLWVTQINQQVQTANASLSASANALTAQLNAVAAQVNGLDPTTQRGQVQALLDQQTNLSSRIADLVKDQDQVALNQQLDLAQPPTMLPAILDAQPTNASRSKFAAAGLVAGLLLGAALAYLLAMWRQNFADRREPERYYETSLLGEIPKFATDGTDGSRLPVLEKPTSPEAEAFRFLGSALRVLSDRDNRGDCLVAVVTSAREGAGKSTVVANTAVALAQSGERVVVIDGDPFRGRTTVLIESVAFKSGLPLVHDLLDPSQAATIDGMSSGWLSVLSSQVDPELADALSSKQRLVDLIKSIEPRCTFILVDAPPVLEASLAGVIVEAVGKTILVVRHGDPVRKEARAKELLHLLGADLVGYVYNGSPKRSELGSYYRSTAATSSPQWKLPASVDDEAAPTVAVRSANRA